MQLIMSKMLYVFSTGSLRTKIVSESLESDGVRVTLECTHLENISGYLYSYDVSVSPHVPVLMLPERRRFQLKVLYETFYSVSIQAIPFCGRRILTTFIGLYFSELILSVILIHNQYTYFKASINCRDLTDQVDDSVTIMGYGELEMRGANVSFVCPPGLILTGPYKSTCMGNGEWEPDPREVECKGER